MPAKSAITLPIQPIVSENNPGDDGKAIFNN